ncbi:unnamed protein product [Schistosoma curassoni]|uniref:Uncharacterized protein n=1 Tax=Schistosoma curassoni TaxID=6186 RepID=A0A183KMK1_9TREM|nr:unnamed protein product [Schistosoma curassoni]
MNLLKQVGPITLKSGFHSYQHGRQGKLPQMEQSKSNLTGLVILGIDQLATEKPENADKLNEFKIALNNRFQALQDLLKEEETTMEDEWEGIKEALTLTCQEVLVLKKHHHKEWITVETLDGIKERKNKNRATNNSRMRAENI